MKITDLMQRPEWLALGVSAVAAGPSLVQAWRQAPLEAWSGVTLAVWLVPLVAELVRHGPLAAGHRLPWSSHSLGFTGAALICLVVGGAADLNFLLHGALALSCAAVAPRCHGRLLGWLVVAPVWMPVVGWLTAEWLAGPVAAARFGVGAAAAAFYFFARVTPASISTSHLSV